MAALNEQSGEAVELSDGVVADTTSPSASTPDPLPARISKLRLIALTAGVLLAIFVAVFDGGAITQVIPSLTDEFGGIGVISWYGTAYVVTNTAFKSVWGRVYKRFHLKPAYLLAIVIFELGNTIAAAAQSSNTVILGRIVAGIGGGGLIAGGFSIIAIIVEPRHRSWYMSLISTVIGVAAVSGPLLGGILVQSLGWRWCFWINLPIGAVAAATIFFSLKQPAHFLPVRASFIAKLASIDLNGAVLVTGALSCYVLALYYAGTSAWSDKSVIGSLLGFVGLAAVFVVNERLMGSDSMVQTHLFKNWTVTANALFALLVSGLTEPLLYILPVQFQSVNGVSPAQSGIRMLPLAIGTSVAVVSANAIINRWNNRNMVMVAGASIGMLGAFVIYMFGGQASTAAWVGFEILCSAGIGLTIQLPLTGAQEAVGIDDIPAATTLVLFFENLGTSIAVAASETAFTKEMLSSARRLVPGVDSALVASTGVTQLRSTFSSAELPAIIMAYLDGCKNAQLVSLVCGGMALTMAIGNGTPSAMKTLRQWKARSHSH